MIKCVWILKNTIFHSDLTNISLTDKIYFFEKKPHSHSERI
jgi:myosin-crossreactive antigen